MKKLVLFVAVFLLVGCVLAQPKMYKGVHLSDGTPAMLDLADSSLVDIGKDWTAIKDTVFTEQYPSTSKDYFNYFIKLDPLSSGYAILKNPGEYPVKKWGYGRVFYKIKAGLWLSDFGLFWGARRFKEKEIVLSTKTPDDDEEAKNKKAYWVWKPNPKGAEAGYLEFR